MSFGEVLSEEILSAKRIEKADIPNVAQFLAKVKAIGLPIAGIMTDKHHALVAAVAEVFPDVRTTYAIRPALTVRRQRREPGQAGVVRTLQKGAYLDTPRFIERRSRAVE